MALPTTTQSRGDSTNRGTPITETSNATGGLRAIKTRHLRPAEVRPPAAHHWQGRRSNVVLGRRRVMSTGSIRVRGDTALSNDTACGPARARSGATNGRGRNRKSQRSTIADTTAASRPTSLGGATRTKIAAPGDGHVLEAARILDRTLGAGRGRAVRKAVLVVRRPLPRQTTAAAAARRLLRWITSYWGCPGQRRSL